MGYSWLEFVVDCVYCLESLDGWMDNDRIVMVVLISNK